MDLFIAKLSEDDLRMFIDTMEHGTDAEQEAAVQRAYDEMFARHNKQ